MNLKKYAEENGLSMKDAKELTGLNHWNQTVAVNETESQEEVAPIVEEAISEMLVAKAEAVAPKKVVEVSMDYKIKQCRGLGTKSPYWSELNG